MRALLGILLAGACCLATAQDGKTAAATRLAEMMQIDEAYGETKSVCVGGADAAAQAAHSYAANREVFSGISPRSAYWPEVIALFSRFREDTCAAHDPGAAKRAYVKMYVERLSLTELQAAIAHMESPAGRAVQAANRDAVRVLASLHKQEQDAATAAAGKRYTANLAQLVARFKAQPR
ncbi:hypothetical protein [Massilia sp. Leaf139]|uniref:hypothetical protein n=1 Tax=Massilia sp. Leaf139 TaxID=1736272 RepID=UPI0007156812|nr:hypothetical protein [Massilia sp. Leaf139]KQQ91615.1 hypothetical protein ASF77_06700 [Massilia sp. Leaf139]